MNETGTMIQAGIITTPELLKVLMKQMAFVVWQKEAKLQVEESSTEIAKMQGYLAGFRKYGTLLMASGFDYDYRLNEEKKCPWTEDDDKLKYSELQKIHFLIQNLKDHVTYKSMSALWDEEVAQKKDFLFYQSEKARDMNWCKGWYQAMNQIESWMLTLDNEYEIQTKMKNESLPFEEDD